MGRVETYQSEKATYHEGQPNTVLSVTECKHFAVRFTDSEGKETMCLVIAFGQMGDGGLGVFRLATATQMAEQLQRLNPNHLEQIRAAIQNHQPGDGTVEVKLNPSVAGALDDLGIGDEGEGEDEDA